MNIRIINVKIHKFFFFQAEDGIRDRDVTGVQTCALPISSKRPMETSEKVTKPIPLARSQRPPDFRSRSAPLSPESADSRNCEYEKWWSLIPIRAPPIRPGSPSLS